MTKTAKKVNYKNIENNEREGWQKLNSLNYMQTYYYHWE